ncbi:hypothetical protein SUGI_0536800 [Cryptomeria japonica]|uniref:uncharacterized protein LOC131039507 n=1 Tax=Cryptomeria japonica TaxID=3369 RepID=UPI002408953A|nr:uncharacterized protein LOC131039507 [Cryptomeria japonica]GLJ27355.1 hypothetical protein SUGI_0536800 [Cryptomeria japonica]
MYSTISIAAYRKAHAAVRNANPQQQSPLLFSLPPDPYSAYLLLEEDEHDMNGFNCWGFRNAYLRELPFPQDKCLTIQKTKRKRKNSRTESYSVYFIPVLGQPISSNCYYVVRAEGKHKGLVETCSTDEDMVTFCCCRSVKDFHPRPLQPADSYQHMKINSRRKSRFKAKSIVSDGFPPLFLRRKHRIVVAKDMRSNHLRLAHVGGENPELRAQLPPFDFPLLQRRPPVVIVAEWYIPFIFINELGTRLEDPKIQLMECPFYKMDLEKFWEEIYSTGRVTEKYVDVEKSLMVEEVLLFGEEQTEEIRDNDGSVLFSGVGKQSRGRVGVKLSWPIIAKMRAGQERYGLEGGVRDVRVKKSFSSDGMAGKFACYVVVERYVLKRMDGSVALSYSFRNSNQIQGKWEV